MLATVFAGGEVPQVPLNQLLVRNVSVIALVGRLSDLRAAVLMHSLSELADWWRDGRLRPHVSQVLPFDRLPEGLDALRTRRATGKIVLEIS